MKQGFWNTLIRIVSPIKTGAETLDVKAKKLRNEVVEEIIENHDDKKISEQKVQEYIEYSQRMDRLVDAMLR